MISIGWRNMKRDPLRMSVAVFGVAFAVLLTTALVGMMLGMTRNASLLVDRTQAELLVSVPNIKTFDFASPMARRKKYLVESVPGVQRVEEYNVAMSVWKLPDGGNATCQIVAFDLDGEMGPMLDISQGRLADLVQPDAVVIDESGRPALGYPRIGDTVEIVNRRARIVGFTRNMQSFSTIPFVFTSLKMGALYGMLDRSPVWSGPRSIYFLVRTAPGMDPAEVARAIEGQVADVEVHTKSGLSRRTRVYWLVETGIGLAFLFTALLALLVGGAIVSQTLYGITLEKIPEFGVLKAMGAGMWDLARIVLEQGLACGVLGLAIGLASGYAAQAAAARAGTVVEIPGWLAVAMAGLALGVSGGASLLSVWKLRTVDPATVFRV